MTLPHEQVWTKVNAQVDRGIAPLISALSQFDALQTLSSCEGYEGRPATVSFRFGNSWKELTEFLFGFFGPRLAQKVGDSARVAAEVTTWGEALGSLSVRPGCVEKVEAAVSELALEFSGQLHKKECSGDTAYTSPEYSQDCRHRQPEDDEHPSHPSQAA